MAKTLEYADLLRLIEERSVAFRAAVSAAPALDRPVPTCPGWTLFDLVQHLGGGHRFWATVVGAGPADAPPPRPVQPAPDRREDLLAWSLESTERLLTALRQAGPDAGCWAWWGVSESPRTAGAVARHQVQEVAVHTYDAQAAAGGPSPLPREAALDGVDEFLSTCCAGPYRWPHEPAAVDYHATEGRSWRLSLAADGVRVARFAAPGAGGAGGGRGAVGAGDAGNRGGTGGSGAADAGNGTGTGRSGTGGVGSVDGAAPGVATASVRGTASELVLALYGRVPVSSLELAGDARVFDQLLAWDPDE